MTQEALDSASRQLLEDLSSIRISGSGIFQGYNRQFKMGSDGKRTQEVQHYYLRLSQLDCTSQLTCSVELFERFFKPLETGSKIKWFGISKWKSSVNSAGYQQTTPGQPRFMGMIGDKDEEF
jgi:hypothetical protein